MIQFGNVLPLLLLTIQRCTKTLMIFSVYTTPSGDLAPPTPQPSVWTAIIVTFLLEPLTSIDAHERAWPFDHEENPGHLAVKC